MRTRSTLLAIFEENTLKTLLPAEYPAIYMPDRTHHFHEKRVYFSSHTRDANVLHRQVRIARHRIIIIAVDFAAYIMAYIRKCSSLPVIFATCFHLCRAVCAVLGKNCERIYPIMRRADG